MRTVDVVVGTCKEVFRAKVVERYRAVRGIIFGFFVAKNILYILSFKF